MRNAILAAVFSGAAFGAIGPAMAASVFPWCPVGRLGWGETGTPSCGFSSYEQCVAATGGACTRNPLYNGPTPAERDTQPRRTVR